MFVLPDWARVHGNSLLEARIRSSNADFDVTELLEPVATGDGEHDGLWIEKTGANTQWLARRLAQHAGVSPRDVGYAGLKDRRALTRQWFSVRRPDGSGTDWSGFKVDGVRILDQIRQARKLRRGAHRGNDFRIALRTGDVDARRPQLIERLQAIAAVGVPNYFGPQRFGRDAGNVDLARRIFDGSGSVFEVTTVDETLEDRCRRMDIHPTGTLWGRGATRRESEVAALESAVIRKYLDLATGLEQAGVEASARPLRLPVRCLSGRHAARRSSKARTGRRAC